MHQTQPNNGFLDLQLGNSFFLFFRTSNVLLPSPFWGNGMVGSKDWLSSPRDALPAKAPPEASRLFLTVNLQVDEICKLSLGRRDVVWPTLVSSLTWNSDDYSRESGIARGIHVFCSLYLP